MIHGVCFVAPAAPPSPESVDDEFFGLRQDGVNKSSILRRVVKVTYLGPPTAPRPLDVDAMFDVWFGSSSSSKQMTPTK